MWLFVTVITISVLSRSEIDFFIPCIPKLQQHFNLSPFSVQLSLSVNFIGYCLGCLCSGLLGDKFNRRIVMLTNLCLFMISTLLCVSTEYYIVLLIGRFLQGMSIAGPAILSYVILIDHCKFKDQLNKLGIINGILTLIMAAAPIVGGHLNMYNNWKTNFLSVLALTFLALYLSYLNIPNSFNHKKIPLSLVSYLVLLKSKKFLIFAGSICFIITPYWVFISISPIYYVTELQVPLLNFIYYKSILAIIFAIVSMMSGMFSNLLGSKNCLFFSIGLCGISILCHILIIIFDINNPKIITLAMGILAAGAAFSINFLYSNALTFIAGYLSRASALIHSFRLIFTSISLSFVSKLYCGEFFIIGIVMIFMLVIGLALTVYSYKNRLLKMY